MNDMKLIMENWNTYLEEQSGDPETVGDLLLQLDAVTLLFGSKTNRIIKQIIDILGEMIGEAQALGTGPDDIRALIEAAEDFLENVLDQGFAGASKIALQEFPVSAFATFLARPPIRKFIIDRIGQPALEFFLNTVLPGAGLVLKGARWMGRMFKVSKATKDIFDTAQATPSEMFTILVNDIMKAPDNKTTTAGFLDKFNVDDEYQKMLDDKVEIQFIKWAIDSLKTLDPSTKVDQLDFNDELIDWLKDDWEEKSGQHTVATV